MAKILFYAHDPGGANAIKPLIEPLLKKSHTVFVYGDGAALSILPDVTKYDANTDILIEKIKPDFVITGTSAANLTEKKLRKSAKKYHIPNLAILDAWGNYNRFTPYSCTELLENKRYGDLEYLPDYYIVMDEFAKQEAIKVKIPENIIYPFGNPHFQSIKDEFEKIDTGDLREKLLNGKDKLIIWASECKIEDYGYGMELEALKDLIEVMPQDARLIVKPHPREKENKFENFKNIKIIRDITSQKLIKSADMVISMTSMVLIETIIAGKIAISYQKNEIDKNKFILTKIGVLPLINDKMTLKENLHKPVIKSDFTMKFDATETIIKFIEDKLCQN